MIFVSYIIIVLGSFYGALRKRGYKVKDLFLGQALAAATFPVYIKASYYAIFNKKSSFQVTAKEGKNSLPLKYLWPQIALGSLCFIAAVWGVNRAIFERYPMGSYVINTLWCLLNSGIIFSILYFNYPKKEAIDEEK